MPSLRLNGPAERALALAAKGYRVLPVEGKKPLFKNWSARSSTDPNTVRRLWRQHPTAGVGIATGDGLAAVDLDRKNGKDGVASWSAWAAEHGVTWEPAQSTRSGGLHLIYQTGDTHGSRVNVLDGVDVRGEGSLVVAYGDLPPVASLPALPRAVAVLIGTHSDRSEGYVDDSPERPADQGVHRYAARAIDAELARLDECETVGWGGPPWDTTTFEVACNLVEFANSNWSGYSLDQAEADLLDHAPADPEFGAAEHAAKWQSARTRIGNGNRPNPDSTPADDFGPAPTAAATVSRLVSGAEFILGAPDHVPAIWGSGDAVLWAFG